jgi:hypothetical protein
MTWHSIHDLLPFLDLPACVMQYELIVNPFRFDNFLLAEDLLSSLSWGGDDNVVGDC